MSRSPEQLRADALAIWQAGVAAVDSQRLVSECVRVEGSGLVIGNQVFDLNRTDRIVVVGAGKAGAGMAQGLEQALGETVMQAKQLVGWVNVPDDCVRSLSRIRLHGARPAGVNEPTEAGVEGAESILRLVSETGPRDLCICLLSGGGSALLPAPAEGISLQEKLAITRLLSGAGANIEQLNTVRKQLSRIKGGGLARACGAGHLCTLVISDVIGDPLDVIASGPTVPNTSTAADAVRVLEEFGLNAEAPAAVTEHLQALIESKHSPPESSAKIHHLVLGNNATAVDAAGVEAERRGYSHAMTAAGALEGPAEDVGRHLASMAIRMRSESGPDCLITGGEPTVALVAAEHRGLGGRNQQLVLAALEWLLARGTRSDVKAQLSEIVLLSGGTDGEDGPTDAAGSWIDATTLAGMDAGHLDVSDYLGRNDAYHFFESVGTLLKTGPTHTNVCDLRVVTVAREQDSQSPK